MPRDTTGQYDGAWDMVVLTTAPRQRYHHAVWRCSNKEGRYGLQVSDSKVKIFGAEDTYIDENGSFRAEIYLDGRYVRSLSSYEVDYYNPIIIYLYGHLRADKRRGRLVYGSYQEGELGCVSYIDFERSDVPNSSALGFSKPKEQE